MSLRAKARKRVLILVGLLFLGGGLIGGYFTVRAVRENRRFAEYRRIGLAEAAPLDTGGTPATQPSPETLQAYNDALDKLRACLRRNPADADCWAALAHTLPMADPSDPHERDTVDALRQLLRLDPNRNDDRRTLLGLYLDNRMMTEANSTADELLNRVKNDPTAIRAKIDAMIGLHQYAEALKLADARIAATPGDWITQINRLRCMAETGHSADETAAAAADLVKRNPDAQGAWLAVAYTNELQDKYSESAVALTTAATRPSGDPEIVFDVVQTLDRDHMHSYAMTALRNAAGLNHPILSRYYIHRLWEDGHLSEVAAMENGPAKQFLQAPDVQGLYADALRRLGRQTESDAIVSTLASRKNDHVALAWAKIESVQKDPSRQGWLDMREACTVAAGERPADAYMPYFIGLADYSLGEVSVAIDEWQKAATLQDTWADPLTKVAYAELTQNQLDAADKAAADAYRRSNGSLEVADARCMIWYAAIEAGDDSHKGDLNELINAILKLAPNDETALRLRIELLAHNGKTDQAADQLRDLLKHQPPLSQRTLLALAEVSRKWNLGLADDCLQLVQKTYGKTAQSLITEAIDDWNKNHDDSGLKLLEAAVADSVGDQRIAYRLDVARYLELTANAGATAAWTALGDQNPDNLTVQRGALDSSAGYKDRDFYGRTIDRVHKLLGDDAASWKLARARWTLDGTPDAKTLSDAIALLHEVLTREPDSIQAHVLMSQAQTRTGDSNAATAELNAAQRLDPKSLSVAWELAGLYYMRGDFATARPQLDLIIKDPKASPALLDQVSSMLTAAGDVPMAIAVLEPIATAPNAPQLYKLQLAELYCRAKLLDKAQAIVDDLMKTPDKRSIVLDANIQLLRGQPDAAEKVLANMDKLIWQPGEKERTEAELFYSFGVFDKAVPLLKAATAAAPKDLPNWTYTMLCQVAMGKMADVPATIAEAAKQAPNDPKIAGLQQVAAIIPTIGQGQTQQQIVTAAILDPSPDSAGFATLKAFQDVLTSSAPPPATLLLQKVQKLADAYPHFLPAQILLIETELRIGRCAEAVEAAGRAMQVFPNEPYPAQLACLADSTYGQWSNALAAANARKSRMIGDVSGVDLQIAQIQLHMNNPAGAEQTLAPYLQRTDLNPAFKWEVVIAQAQCLVVEGKHDQAIQLLWPAAQNNPEHQPVFMGFLTSNVSPAEAEPWLTQLDATLASQPDSENMQIALATTWNILYGRSGNRQYDQKARDLVAKLQQNPKCAALADLTLGIFDDASSDLAGAEAAYRLALSKADLPEASNNLAVILSDKGKIDEAIVLAQKCVKGAPNEATYRDTLAYILAKAKKYDDAIAAETMAVHLEPDTAKWEVNLARILVEAGKYSQAKQQLAELDLMTPGVRSLNDKYKTTLDDVRKQVELNFAAAPTH